MKKDDPEMRADIEALGEKLQSFGGSGVGGHVVIGGLAVKKKIANAAPHEEGLVALALQRIANRIHELARVHRMIMRQEEGSNEAKKQRNRNNAEFALKRRARGKEKNTGTIAGRGTLN